MAHNSADGDRYYGVLAESYDAYLVDDEIDDFETYMQYIAEADGPALELACGTGRLLVPYLEAGRDVEGLDSSSEMLAICRRKAENVGRSPTLHCASMENFVIDKKYGLIFCPVASLTLLASPGALEAALANMRHHLTDGGKIAINMDRPSPKKRLGELRLAREVEREKDGAMLRCWMETLPPRFPQTQRYRMANEVLLNGKIVESEECELEFRPMEPEDFEELLKHAGYCDIRLLDSNGTDPIGANKDSYLAIATSPRTGRLR